MSHIIPPHHSINWEGGRREITYLLLSPLHLISAPRLATTCQALQQVANASNEDLECTTNGEKNCDTLTCTTAISNIPVTAELTVLSCADIPAVNMTVEAVGKVINEVLSESQVIPIVPNLVTADVTLDQLDGAIGILVR